MNLEMQPSLPNGLVIGSHFIDISQKQKMNQNGLLKRALFPSFHSSLEKLRQKINWYFQLKDATLATEFALFNKEQYSIGFLLYSLIIYTLLAPITFYVLAKDITSKQDSKQPGVLHLSIVNACFATVTVVFGWTLFHHHRKQAYTTEQQELVRVASTNSLESLSSDSDSTKQRPNIIVTFCDWLWKCQLCNPIFIIASQLMLTGIFIRNAATSQCCVNSMQISSIFNCRESVAEPSSFLVMAMIIMFVSVLNFANIPDTRIEVAWLSLFITICLFIIIVAFQNIKESSLLGVMLILSAAFTIIDIQIRNILIFLTNRKLLETLAENERIANELHASEMRHMIGNVAHDLKTPLASFVTAMDIIQFTINGCSEKLAEGTMSMSDVKEVCDSIQGCTIGIRNTTSFMMMTINRCIDYTKASNGLRLIPKCATINWMDVITLPLNCMRTIQQRIHICLLDVPKSICAHIITDPQWLHENILCLVSNAVKFSTDGDVTIRVSLHHSPSDDPITDRGDPSNSDYNNNFIAEVRELHAEKTSTNGAKHARQYSDLELGSHPHYIPMVNQTFLKFEIEDCGVGLSEEVMKQLFQPFKQAQRLTGGTGLGLYSLAKRVEALGGQYGVESRKGAEKGTLFWFMIPYQPDHLTSDLNDGFCSVTSAPSLCSGDSCSLPGDLNARHETSCVGQVGASKGENEIHSEVVWTASSSIDAKLDRPLKFLLVDDSPAILKMTAMMLKKLGHHITTADNGEVAYRLVQEHSRSNGNKPEFDVVLMDLQMPVMDGLESVKCIREFEDAVSSEPVDCLLTSEETESKNKPCRHLIIGMSANSDDATIELAYEAGVDAFIPKPFQIDAFRELLIKLAV